MKLKIIIFILFLVKSSYQATVNSSNNILNFQDITNNLTIISNYYQNKKTIEEEIKGTCGDNQGTGNMNSYSLTSFPWYENRSIIKYIDISQGATTITSYVFNEFTALESITIPSIIESIGNYSFYVQV